MNLAHEFGAWWFFADLHTSPAATFGAFCFGAWLPSLRRWLWLHLTPQGRSERQAASRYWRNIGSRP